MEIKDLAQNHLWPTYLEFSRSTEPFLENGWENTPLIGSGSLMDSLKFVQFIIEMEKRLGIPGKLSRITDTTDPYKTLGAFARHIQKALEN